MNDFLIWLWNQIWLMSAVVGVLVILLWFTSKIFKNISANYYYLFWIFLLIRLCIPVDLNFLSPEILPNELISSINSVIVIEDSPIKNIDSLYSVANNSVKQFSFDLWGVVWLASVLLIGFLFLFKYLRWYHLLLNRELLSHEKLHEFVNLCCKKMDLRRSFRIYVSNEGPCVGGFWQKYLILPKEMVYNWSLEDIEPILFHELTHLKKRDLLCNMLQNIVQIIYFFHPLVWFINAEIRRFRELRCDAIAVTYTSQGKKHYCQKILDAAIFIKSLNNYSYLHWAQKKSLTYERVDNMLNSIERNKSRIPVVILGTLILLSFVTPIIGQSSSGDLHSFYIGEIPESVKSDFVSLRCKSLSKMLKEIPGVAEVKFLQKNSQLIAQIYCSNEVLDQVKEILQKAQITRNSLYEFTTNLILLNEATNSSITAVAANQNHMNKISKILGKTIVSAPKGTTFSHQRFNVSVLEKISYISDFDVIISAATVKAEPVIDYVNPGLKLELRLEKNLRQNKQYVYIDLENSQVKRPIPNVKTTVEGFGVVTMQVPEMEIDKKSHRIEIGELPQMIEWHGNTLHGKPIAILILVDKAS
ncbi:M56 family metallopeptidase [Candidatus Uabimicrobium sp. HlEnr_7]|uniref:M56 family metallopeptidase n=1 Tax=Candidatus Uabimicrobium helgolandensis TaxID=3095367 RepID=UPI0035583DB1